MNGSAQRRGPKQRLFDGRIEKRLPASVIVYLATQDEPRVRERTSTENVSAHGARIITERPWHFGEQAIVAPRGEFPQVGRVVYCGAKTGGHFCLGVEFRGRSVKWDEDSRT